MIPLKEDMFIPAIKISNNPVWQRLVHLGTKRGIKMFADDFRGTPLEGEVRGFYIGKNEFNAIVVDSSLPEEQRQFTLAHELGHYALHRGSAYNFDSPKELKAKNEREADYFANRLLHWVRKGQP